MKTKTPKTHCNLIPLYNIKVNSGYIYKNAEIISVSPETVKIRMLKASYNVIIHIRSIESLDYSRDLRRIEKIKY